MNNKRKENSVKNLGNLYTVVIGVALSLAVARLVDADKGLQSITLASGLLFAAFVATLFPFYHGALRHLDDAYIENDNEHIKDGALIFDFILLFLHALTFVVLALLLKQPEHFIWVLIILLAVDVIWGVFTYFAASSSGSGLTAESKWTIINFVFVGISTWYLVAHNIDFSLGPEPLKLAIPITFVCILRSVVDYVWCKAFYFPN